MKGPEFEKTVQQRRSGADNHPLSVLYVVHGFPPDTWAGTEVYTLNLAREMKRLGHRVTVLARAPADRSVEDGGPADFSISEDWFQDLRVLRMVHRLCHGSLRESYDQPKAVEAFRRVLLREKPDLVHFQHLIHTSAGLVQQAKDFNLPTVLHCHDYWAICPRVQMIRPDGVICEQSMGYGCYLCVMECAMNQIEGVHQGHRFPPASSGEIDHACDKVKTEVDGIPENPRFWDGFSDLARRYECVLSAYAAADLLISPSRFLRRKLMETGRFNPETFVYSDNGLRTDLIEALNKLPDPEGKIRFGYVGSLVWYKGCEVMIKAMNRLSRKPCVLNVYGDFRPEEDAFHERLERLADQGNVRFMGRFDNTEISRVYSEIDVLIVPSLWYENSPITIHEAFLAGTPVVTSNIGGMAEYVRDGVDGLHFRVGDAGDLCLKLARFLDEPGLIRSLSRNWPQVKGIEENARELASHYRALVHRKRDRRPRILLDYTGNMTVRRKGPVEIQGADMLLLRPGGAEAAYDIELARGGRREIRVDIVALGGEESIELGGRFFVDDVKAAYLPPFTGGQKEEMRTVVFQAVLGNDAQRLCIDTRAGLDGQEVFLRIKRVMVGDVGCGRRCLTSEAPFYPV